MIFFLNVMQSNVKYVHSSEPICSVLANVLYETNAIFSHFYGGLVQSKYIMKANVHSLYPSNVQVLEKLLVEMCVFI